MKQLNTLYVQMFVSFQMSYGSKPLTGGTRRDTYFSSLMQILLHNAKTGVSRDYLEDVLLGDRDIENRHQALQTIIYKAKRKLRNMGLPDVNYIALEKGVYHWTPLIPVEEDAAVIIRGLLKPEMKRRDCLSINVRATNIKENFSRLMQASYGQVRKQDVTGRCSLTVCVRLLPY